MATNCLALSERIEIGKEKEAETIELLNLLVKSIPQFGGVVEWRPASRADDINRKIDAWAVLDNGEEKSVQIKFRETGQDLGIALIRPWSWDRFKVRDVEVDRDFKEMADIYVVLNEQFSQLVIGSGPKIKRICEILLNGLIAEDENPFEKWNYWRDDNRYGAELRLVTDQGEGYTEGQEKVIAYIKPFLVEKQGGLITYYDPTF